MLIEARNKVKPLIILISSDLPQQGKDTCAKFIQSSLKMYSNIESVICSFASELKKFVHHKYNVDEDKLAKDPDYKEQIRHLYIKEGDGARLSDSFIWCKALFNAVIRLFLETIKDDDIPVIIIPDCRYLNEENYVEEKELSGLDAFVWHIHVLTSEQAMIERFGAARYDKIAATMMSRSQRELNIAFTTAFDSILGNSGTLAEFELRTHHETEIIMNNYMRSIDK
jgi:hypothetical protein